MAYSTRRTLLQQILSGDEIAWNEFYEQYHRLIFSIGKRWNLPDDKCYDLVQQVMLSIFQKQLTFKYRPELGKFRTFLIGITRNILLQLKDADAKYVLTDDAEFDRESDVNEAIFNEEWRKYLLDTMLEELRNIVDDTTFDAFQMYVLQGIRPEIIAKTLNISVSTVYVHKKRCLAHLRDNLEILKKNDPEFKI